MHNHCMPAHLLVLRRLTMQYSSTTHELSWYSYSKHTEMRLPENAHRYLVIMEAFSGNELSNIGATT